MRRRKIIGCLLVFLLIMGLTGYGVFRVLRTMAQAKQKALEFTNVRRGTILHKVSETGTIAADLQVEVKSKVAGRISELLVDEGDRVRQGQLLARVDPTEVERQANQAAADVQAGQARLEQAQWGARQQREGTRLGIRQAEARLSAAEANLRRLQAGSRHQELAQAEAAISRAQADAEEAREALTRALELQKDACTPREDAEAALEVARADLRRLEAGNRPQEVARARALVSQAQASADDADRTLARSRELSKKGFVAHQETDAAQAASDRAHALLEEARQGLALVQAGARTEELEVAKARVRQAQIAARSAGSSSDQSVITARARAAAADASLRSAREQLSLLRVGPRKEEIEAAQAQVEEAQASLEVARSATSRDAAAQAEVKAARADVLRVSERMEAARVQLADTYLLAPISGTVTQRHIQAGELVASGTSGLSAGIPVVTIADLSTLLVKVRLNEVDVAQVQPGEPAEVRVDAYPGVVFPGRVRRISPAAGGRTGQGGDTQIVRFDVEVALIRPDARLRTGMTASVDVILDRREKALYVTQEALTRDKGRWVAEVVKEPAKLRKLPWAERRKLTAKDVPTRKVTVKTGLRDDIRAEVLSGLKENDLILISSAGRVQRRKVKIGGED